MASKLSGDVYGQTRNRVVVGEVGTLLSIKRGVARKRHKDHDHGPREWKRRGGVVGVDALNVRRCVGGGRWASRR